MMPPGGLKMVRLCRQPREDQGSRTTEAAEGSGDSGDETECKRPGEDQGSDAGDGDAAAGPGGDDEIERVD